MFITMLPLPKINLKIKEVAVPPMYSHPLNKLQLSTHNKIVIISMCKALLKIGSIIFKMILKKDSEIKQLKEYS